jgi:rod shape-determining protein MreD
VIPFVCGLIAVVAGNLPISVPGNLVAPPLLALIPIYFWCLVRPDLMTPAVTFIIGLAQDILCGGPPGVWTLCFVLTYAVIDRQRDSFAGLSGIGAVLGFAMAALMACVTAYAIVMVYYWRMPLVAPIISQFVITVLFYIPGAYLLGAIHRRLVGPLRGDI